MNNRITEDMNRQIDAVADKLRDRFKPETVSACRDLMRVAYLMGAQAMYQSFDALLKSDADVRTGYVRITAEIIDASLTDDAVLRHMPTSGRQV